MSHHSKEESQWISQNIDLLGQGEPEWYGLDVFIVGALEPYFPNAMLLQASFDDEQEALDMIRSLQIDGLQPEVFKEWAATLQEWRSARAGSFKRARLGQVKLNSSIGFPMSTVHCGCI